jgi:hypothetical protein
VRALDLDRIEFLVLDEDVGVLADLIALDAVLGVDRLAGRRVDVLLLDAVSGRPVEGVEADPR